MSEVKIVCPNCNWAPDGKPYWECHCGHVWNTFETAGRCPSCHFQHNYTQCVAHAGGCTTYSLHVDWYQGLEEMVESLVEPVKIRVRR
jgi:hypothetical protein